MCSKNTAHTQQLSRRTLLGIGFACLFTNQAPAAVKNPNGRSSLADILNMDWRFIQKDGLLSSYRIRFTPNGYISGHDGCNAFRGQYSFENERFRFSRVMATRRHCGGKIAKQKAQWRGYFLKAASFERQGNLLLLFDGQNQLIAKLEGSAK